MPTPSPTPLSPTPEDNTPPSDSPPESVRKWGVQNLVSSTVFEKGRKMLLDWIWDLVINCEEEVWRRRGGGGEERDMYGKKIEMMCEMSCDPVWRIITLHDSLACRHVLFCWQCYWRSSCCYCILRAIFYPLQPPPPLFMVGYISSWASSFVNLKTAISIFGFSFVFLSFVLSQVFC